MEKKKSEITKWLIPLSKVLILLGLIVGMFCISASTGVASVVFGLMGYLFGYFSKKHKLSKKMMEELVANKEDFLAGKMITVSLDLESETPEVSIMATEPKEKEPQPAEVVEQKLSKFKKKKKDSNTVKK